MSDSTADLRRWAAGTWRSLTASLWSCSGLPADHVGSDLEEHQRAEYTSPAVVGGLLWSSVAARELGLVGGEEASRTIADILTGVEAAERHEASGLWPHWWEARTGRALSAWPGSARRVHPYVSTVDNAWLATGLRVVAGADPSQARRALALAEGMRWEAVVDPAGATDRPTGDTTLLRGGFYPGTAPRVPLLRGSVRGAPVRFARHHYDILVSEARMGLYLAVDAGAAPACAYYVPSRHLPGWGSPGQEHHLGPSAVHLGVPVAQGAHVYRGLRVLPSWGGSMFEDLMPTLFVPEETWGPRSWGRQHPAYVHAHREHGLHERAWGAWGFSPAADPTRAHGYLEFGVDALGADPRGYHSDVVGARRARRSRRAPSGTRPSSRAIDGVAAPYASFLALRIDPESAVGNLRHLEERYECVGLGGFADAVALRSGGIAPRHLVLDQAMILAAVANALADDAVRRAFLTARFETVLRPLMEAEDWPATSQHV